MILSRFVFKEPFTVPKVTAMVLVTLGIIAINGADFQAHGLSWGVACGFLGAVCFALLIVVMKKAKPLTGFFAPACQLIIASILVGAVTYNLPTPDVNLTIQDMSYMALLGFINTGLGYASILPASSACRPRASPSAATSSPSRPSSCQLSSLGKS